MNAWIENLAGIVTTAGGKLLLAAVVLIVGCVVIKTVVKTLKKSKAFGKLEGTVASFAASLISGALYLIFARWRAAMGRSAAAKWEAETRISGSCANRRLKRRRAQEGAGDMDWEKSISPFCS